MKKLLLIRHAKSGYKHEELLDFGRTLNAEGRAEAAALAQALGKLPFSPDTVLCSPSARTVQTLHFLLQDGWTDLERVVFLPELYLAPPSVLHRAAGAAKGPSVAVIAHNPGLSELAEHLLGRSGVPSLETAGWHLLEKNAHWKRIAGSTTA